MHAHCYQQALFATNVERLKWITDRQKVVTDSRRDGGQTERCRQRNEVTRACARNVGAKTWRRVRHDGIRICLPAFELRSCAGAYDEGESFDGSQRSGEEDTLKDDGAEEMESFQGDAADNGSRREKMKGKWLCCLPFWLAR